MIGRSRGRRGGRGAGLEDRHRPADRYRDLDALTRAEVSRRGFLGGAVAAGVAAGCGFAVPGPGDGLPVPALPDDPFTLGVASGDPTPNGIVLWTRLAPDPLAFGGGMDPIDVPVIWELAVDPDFEHLHAWSTAVARPEHAHAVHVQLDAGLFPNLWYWYRFRIGDQWTSPVGRTRTAPGPQASPAELRFAVASCQDYQNGYYTAYRHLAEEDLDVVVHLGDYIYEYGPSSGAVRQHVGGETFVLDDYRRRYAQYRLDPDLQAAHARFPWIVTFDDHEVVNNYAGEHPPDSTPTAAFLARRGAAYQAYYEHLPIRRPPPVGPDFPVYRRLTFGDLLTFHVLDTRQYRDDQPCFSAGDVGFQCADARAPSRRMLGDAQKIWLEDGLLASQSRWDVVAQQVVMAELDFSPLGTLVNLDQWDGYVASRTRVLDALRAPGVTNPVVLSGDIHSNWVNDLKVEFTSSAPTIATELVTTSISSSFPSWLSPFVGAVRSLNPHVRWVDGSRRGYLRCTATPDALQADFRTVSTITEPTASISTQRSWRIADGQPGAVEV